MSIGAKFKRKPPLPVFSNGVSSLFDGAVSADELEKIANVLTLHADVHEESNEKETIASSEALRPADVQKCVASSSGENPSLWSSSIAPPCLSSGFNAPTTPSITEPINSSTPKTGSSIPAKTSTSERYVIDLCMSSDDSAADDKEEVQTEESPTVEAELEDGTSNSPMLSPLPSDDKNLPTPDLPSPASLVKKSSETIEVIGVVGLALPYPEEDPKSYSDYTKTPPNEPVDTHAMTPPFPSHRNQTLSDEWHSSPQPLTEPNRSNVNCTPPQFAFEPDPEPGGSSHILPTPPEEDESFRFPSMLPDPDLKILPRKDHSTSLEESSDELKVDADVPATGIRKRKQVPEKEEGRSRKSKRAKVARDGQQYDSRILIVDCVKKCIQEVNSKLDKSRFKVLCRRVSKRLLGAWSIRKPARQRNIERWLKHRHVKIVRLVEKYLEKNLV